MLLHLWMLCWFLLIIFMVTAPLLTVGVQVDLPESAADSLPDDQEPLNSKY